jgi:hypothetical protein
VKWPTAASNLELHDDIWPADQAPVIRRLGDGINAFKVLPLAVPRRRAKKTARYQSPLGWTAIFGRPLSAGIA